MKITDRGWTVIVLLAILAAVAVMSIAPRLT